MQDSKCPIQNNLKKDPELLIEEYSSSSQPPGLVSENQRFKQAHQLTLEGRNREILFDSRPAFLVSPQSKAKSAHGFMMNHPRAKNDSGKV